MDIYIIMTHSLEGMVYLFLMATSILPFVFAIFIPFDFISSFDNSGFLIANVPAKPQQSS